MVYTAADPGSACPRAESAKFPFFFLIFQKPKECFAAFHQIVKKSRNLHYKKLLFFKEYESVNFCLWRAWPGIRRPWTCSRPHTYMHHTDPQIYLLWPNSATLSLAVGGHTISVDVNTHDGIISRIR